MALSSRIAVAVVLWAISEPLLLEGSASTAEALAFGLLTTLPLLAAARAPLAVGGVVVAAYLAQHALGARMDGAMSPELALAFGLFAVAAYAPGGTRQPWAGLPLTAAVPVGLWLTGTTGLFEYLYASAVAVAGVLPGLAVRERRTVVAALEAEVAGQLARTPLAVDAAVAGERRALSRRTADVVSALVDDLSGFVVAARAGTEGAGRRMVDAAGAAGAELRRLLGTLHAPDQPREAPRAPVDWRARAGLAFPWLGLAALGVAVLLTLPELPTTLGPLHFGTPVVGAAGALGWTLLTPAGLLLRRRAPVAGLVVVALFILGGLGLRVFSSLTITPVFTCGVMAYAAGAYGRTRAEAVAGGAVTLATAGLFWRFEQYHFGWLEYAYMVGVLAGTWTVGRAIRSDLRDAVLLRDRARVLRAQRDRLCEAAVRGERRDIARELHDVVGHALTLIAVQAGVVSVLSERDARRAGQALDVIEAVTRTVTAELDSLRTALGPAELEHVVADARAAGQPVAVTIDHGFAALPVPVRTVIARIVREALTNARKHAAGAIAHVGVTVAEEVEISVRNGSGEALDVVPAGSGMGVPGMRERAAALGGTLAAGPDGTGGWSVRVTLPRSAERELAA